MKKEIEDGENSTLYDFLQEYKQNIKDGKVPLDENYTCKVCEKQFCYRPISCRVICNDCMLDEDEFVVLGQQVQNWKEDELR